MSGKPENRNEQLQHERLETKPMKNEAELKIENQEMKEWKMKKEMMSFASRFVDQEQEVNIALKVIAIKHDVNSACRNMHVRIRETPRTNWYGCSSMTSSDLAT